MIFEKKEKEKMNFKKAHWSIKDGQEYENYLDSIKGSEFSRGWEKRIVCTNLPTMSIKTAVVNNIVKDILKGDYRSFLDLFLLNNHTETIIFAKVLSGAISKTGGLKDYKNLLCKFCASVDNWASIDGIKFCVKDENKDNFWALACGFTKSDKTFVRRAGYRIFFSFANDANYIKKAFNLIEKAYDEKEYYVNMCISWLLCECFIKNREITLEFLKTGKLNKFVKNKTISKCCDSFRVSNEDKELLRTLRIVD